MSWIWTWLGLVLRTPYSVMGVSMFILFPLTFVSNVFVDPVTVPAGLQAFVNVNPVTILVNAMRVLMHGTATMEQIITVLLISGLFTLVFGPLTMYKYKYK